MKPIPLYLNVIIVTMWTIVLVAMMHKTYKNTTQAIEERINCAMKECIIEDFQQRNKHTRIIFKQTGKKMHKSTFLYDEEGIKHYIFKDSVPAEIAYRLNMQFYLAQSNPLIPDSFQVLLKDRLKPAFITGESTIAYSDRNQSYFSKEDRFPLATASYRTPIYKLDTSGNIAISAWFKYDWATLIHYMPSYIWLLFGGILLPIISLIAWYINRRKLPKEQKEMAIQAQCAHKEPQLDHRKEEENEITPQAEATEEVESQTVSHKEHPNEKAPTIEPNNKETLVLKKKVKCLYINSYRELVIDGMKIQTSETILNLFQLLLDARKENTYLSRDLIRKTLWREENINSATANSRIDTHIKEVRKLLKGTDYSIQTVRGMGFQLCDNSTEDAYQYQKTCEYVC